MSTGPFKTIALIGMPGAGKTTVAKLLAKELQLNFIDCDQEVEKVTKESITNFIKKNGETKFRIVEREVFVRIVEQNIPSVLSLGGGTVLDSYNRELISKLCTCVYLKAEPQTLRERLNSSQLSMRPLLDGSLNSLEDVYHMRKDIYESLANVVVETDNLTPSEVVEKIVKSVNIGL